MTDDAIAKLYICDVEFRQIEGNGRTFRHIELRNSVISVAATTATHSRSTRDKKLKHRPTNS